MTFNKQIYENVVKCCEDIGKFNILGIPIESASPRFLDVTEENLNEHVRMQPGLIAFFGTKKKEAERNYYYKKQAFEAWKKIKYNEVKGGMDKAKPTVNEIESQIMIDTADEYEKWVNELQEAQEMLDTFEIFYEAIKQKSFSIREFALLASDEWRIKDNIESKSEIKPKIILSY